MSIRQNERARRSSPEGRAQRIAQGERRRERLKAEGRSVSGNPYKPPELQWRDRLWNAHGLRPEAWWALWDAQGGRCYLCGDELARETAVIDHDHACCPPGKSCAFCRRGLCCGGCNSAIGFARDDPDRLERMAASLRAAQLEVTLRMAGKPVQETLNPHDGDMFEKMSKIS